MFMDITPDRKVDSILRNGSTNGATQTRGNSFAWKKRIDSPGADKRAPSEVFQSASRGFRRADLKSPARVNEMVGDAVNQLLQTEFPNLAAANRQVIGEWMRRDPILRGWILRGFERTLS
jgi:hypothetical protein